MALPSFIDYAIAETSLKVENTTTRGSFAFKTGSATMSVAASISIIATPDVGSVVLAQDNMMVQRTGATLSTQGMVYSGSTTGLMVQNEYYGGQKLTLFANTQKPAIVGQEINIQVDRYQRLYWS